MYKDINWDIIFTTKGKRYRLALLDSVRIVSSVNNLADTAEIVLPETVMNRPLDLEKKIVRGSEVSVLAGYNAEQLETEFTGYVREVVNTGGNLTIMCEDALFLFRTGIADKQLKQVNIQKIAQYVVSQIDGSYSVDCDYNITYEKFVIHSATGYDVLKKIQEETHAHIWFDTANKVLHIHPAYLKKTGEVYYSMQMNIEDSSLEFKNRQDDKLEVVVESTDIQGKVHKVTAGTTGGRRISVKVGTMDQGSLQQLAKQILKQRSAPKYEGSFDTWLEPMVRPGYSARIKDEEYPDKTAWYYVESVETQISRSGGKRSITPGIKLASSK